MPSKFTGRIDKCKLGLKKKKQHIRFYFKTFIVTLYSTSFYSNSYEPSSELSVFLYIYIYTNDPILILTNKINLFYYMIEIIGIPKETLHDICQFPYSYGQSYIYQIRPHDFSAQEYSFLTQISIFSKSH